MHAADHTSFDFPPHIDESQLTNLTKLPSSLVLPARIAEAAMQLECVVKHIHIAADTATKTPKVGEHVIIIPRIGIIYECKCCPCCWGGMWVEEWAAVTGCSVIT
jgi:flavin reductase (DIM6/NTAB) family NADH-FMN oxidoreductase RutF